MATSGTGTGIVVYNVQTAVDRQPRDRPRSPAAGAGDGRRRARPERPVKYFRPSCAPLIGFLDGTITPAAPLAGAARARRADAERPTGCNSAMGRAIVRCSIRLSLP